MELGRHDPFGDVSSWDEEEAATWATRLDARAAAPDQARLRAEVLSFAAPEPGETVVEVGCGTGVLLEELARTVAPDGRALGVEPQAGLARAARARRLEVVEAHGEDLPLEDGSIDLADAGAITQEDADRWIEQLHAQQPFFSSLNYVVCLGLRQ